MCHFRPRNHAVRSLILGVAFTLIGAFLNGRADALETTLSAPGAPPELAERLTAASGVMAADARGLDTVQEYLSVALSDYRTLVQVAYDSGYFSPVVRIRLDGREAADIPPLNPPASVQRIDVVVDVGRQFRFGTARVAPLAPATELPEDFRKGAVATTAVIRDATFAGAKAWRHAGHAKVAVGKQRITANHGQALLNADIALAPGPQLRFGQLRLTGETDVRPDAIRAIAGFPTGEVFHPDAVQKVGTRLRRTGTFSSVALKEADAANPDGTLDVTAEFADLPKRRLTFGAELSSSEGLDLTFEWTHRNLFKGAERLRFESRLRNLGTDSDVSGRIGLRLDRPATLGPDDNTYYLIELESLDELHYTALRGLLGVGVRRVFSETFFAETALAVDIHRTKDVYGERRFKFLTIPTRLEADNRDSTVNATRGTYFDARITPFFGVSDTESGLTMLLDGRGYLRLNPAGSLVAAGRVQLGSTVGPGQANASPLFLFYSGGAGSVRGQPFESLGVPVAGGIGGGRGYLALSGELRGNVTDKISLVGFYDVGLIDADSFVSSNSSRHAGAGIGLRYNLGGFGPLRLDLAWPVEGSTSDGFQFYIGIGQAF